VSTDPPNSPEGYRLFWTRAIDQHADEGRNSVCFGQRRRASERGLDKHRAIADAGLLVEEVVPDFTTYEGASSIGARSALFVLSRTPRTKAIVTGASRDGDLYTSRSPKRKKKR
jgi:predicted methyltransferase